MQRIGYAAIVLAALTSCILFASSAQARWAPGGSYERSCRNVNFDGDTLTASCRRDDGFWRNTWLPNADNCDGNISNDNGQLECSDRASWHSHGWDRSDEYSGPSGPYQRTCTNIRMDGYTLKATCQRNNGAWRWSQLYNAYNCDGRIWNSNGRLVCGGRF